MHHRFNTREYVLAGAFALLAAFPLVSEVTLVVPLDASVTGGVVHRAAADRSNQSSLRRLRWSVLRDCSEREQNGEVDVCPDAGDVDALYDYWTPAVREAAPAKNVVKASMSDLGQFEKGIIRKARRVGACPENLDALVPGFQELCDDTVRDYGRDAGAITEAANKLLGKPSR